MRIIADSSEIYKKSCMVIPLNQDSVTEWLR